MRRIAALGLVLLFSLQTTASAATLSSQPFSIQPVIAAIKESQVFAVLSGQGNRYALEHAPAPVRVRLSSEAPRLHDLRKSRVVPSPMLGVMHDAHSTMLQGPISPKNIVPDPLAVSGKVSQTKPRRPVVKPNNLRAQVTSAASTTGLTAWWSYYRRTLSGAGDAAMNVASGNFLLQKTDVAIAERGIGYNFTRTYNSQSGHDAANTDGSTPAVFGNGWSNIFDAHLAYNATTNVLSAYDADGARYDYTADGNGGWVPPPGVHRILGFDGNCGYIWWNTDGSLLYFWSPTAPPRCVAGSAYQGRLYRIYGRNQSNFIALTYSWVNSDASNPENLTQITVSHSDGHSMTFTFGKVYGHTELTSITLPDGVHKILYWYDAAGDLVEVDHPSNAVDDFNMNQTTATACAASVGSAGCAQDAYGYDGAGHHLLIEFDSPRYVWSIQYTPSSPYGAYYNVTYDANARLSRIDDFASVNFIPNDNMGQALHSESGAPGVGMSQWYSTTFSGWGSSQTTFGDTSGHAAIWSYDGSGRVVSAQAWTGRQYLLTTTAWDTQNNPVATTDARGNETDYTYDGNGNATSIQKPSVPTSLGVLRPTTRFGYDGHNNLVSACDAQMVATSGATTCSPSTVGAAQFVYDNSDANEPFGRLDTVYDPLGYHYHFVYDPSAQGGAQYGLPTWIQGAGITQVDGSTRIPNKTFSYDGHGNLTNFNDGNQAWSMSYDSMNRLLTRSDAEGATSYTYYNDDGTVKKTETPAQHAGGTGSSVLYDVDGNPVQTTVWRQTASGTAAVAYPTTKWYDGADRLVEVKQQPDTQADAYANPWATRYMYDLTAGNQVSYHGTNFYAFGNLYKTQEFLPPGAASGPVTMSANTPQSMANGVPVDLKATAFDALDRPVTNYSAIAQNGSEMLNTETMTYDSANPQFPGIPGGLLSQDCNALNKCSYYNYDAVGNVVNVNFNDPSSPNRTATYDPDGRVATIGSTAYSTPVTLQYDADGRETSYAEAQGGGVTSPATFTHRFYPDGAFQQLDVQSSALNQTGLFMYSYRADGKVQTESINNAANPKVASTSVQFQYSPAGRPTQRGETGPGAIPGATTYSYDSNFQLNSVTLPTCSWCAPTTSTIAGLSYDPQGQILSETTTKAQTFMYTTRGELRGPNNQSFMANGVPISMGDPNFVSTNYMWDALAGAIVGSDQSSNDGSSDSGASAAYDSAGRMTRVDVSGANSSDDILDRGFDSENHTVSSDDNASTISAGGLAVPASTLALYNWGPTGRPVRIGSATASTMPSAGSVQYDTLHWDGEQLIFTTNSSGQVDDIKVGSQADITPLDPSFTGITFWDRGPGGAITYCHNATGVSGGSTSVYSKGAPCYAGSGLGTDGVHTIAFPSSFLWDSGENQFGSPKIHSYLHTVGIGQGKLLGLNRTDGFTDGLNTFQGVRTYDSTLGQWSTPDDYPGDAHSPATQKSYLWNGGNPAANVDPSGHCFTGTSYHANGLPAGMSIDCSHDGGQVCFDCYPEEGWPTLASDLVTITPILTLPVVIKSPPRNADFVQYQVCLGPDFGGCITFTGDKCGSMYFGLQGQAGKSPTLVSVSVTGNWVSGSSTPQNIKGAIQGWGYSGGGGFVGGAQTSGSLFPLSPPNSTGAGGMSPQLGGSISVIPTFQVQSGPRC